MKVNDLVSVVITTYRREISLLSQAIDSVRQQTYRKFEIIVVDDNGKGSDYQMANQLFLTNQKDITYIVNKKNSGAQFSRNQGILASKGEILAFLDDDDIWMKKKLEIQLNYLKKYDVGLVFCDGYKIKDGNLDNKKKYQDFPVFDTYIGFEQMLFRDYVGTTTQVLIRKECFANVGIFDSTMPARQDYEMWLRISKEYNLVGVSETLFYHRIHSGEQISKDMNKVLMGYTNIYNKYRNEYKKCPKAKAKLLLKLCRFNFIQEHYIEAAKYLVCGIITNPKIAFSTAKNFSLD